MTNKSKAITLLQNEKVPVVIDDFHYIEKSIQKKIVRALKAPIMYGVPVICIATVYKGNIIKNLIMDCQSYTKYRPNETTGGIFVSWRR